MRIEEGTSYIRKQKVGLINKVKSNGKDRILSSV